MSRVIVLGASSNPWRYSYLATRRLAAAGYEVIAIGNKEGMIADVPITVGQPDLKDVDTVTVYLRPELQKLYYDYLIKLAPRRVIFNPGAENPELAEMLSGVDTSLEQACTLVMLSMEQF